MTEKVAPTDRADLVAEAVQGFYNQFTVTVQVHRWQRKYMHNFDAIHSRKSL